MWERPATDRAAVVLLATGGEAVPRLLVAPSRFRGGRECPRSLRLLRRAEPVLSCRAWAGAARRGRPGPARKRETQTGRSSAIQRKPTWCLSADSLIRGRIGTESGGDLFVAFFLRLLDSAGPSGTERRLRNKDLGHATHHVCGEQVWA